MSGLIYFVIFYSFYFGNVSSKSLQLILDEDRKLQNLLISINNDVLEDNGNLLSSIKTQMTTASKALYKATSTVGKSKAGVQFGEVSISVPYHWNVDGNPLTWEKAERANFRVVNSKDNEYSLQPNTKQNKKCGKPGAYSTFPVEFFGKNTNKKFNLLRNGKEIMREFVKLRYGVFSEEPYKNILFMRNGSQFLKGTCNHAIEWEVNESTATCTDKNFKCQYKIKENQSHNYSLMFDTETPSSEYFCNDGDRPHNSMAYNLQNIRCKGKSIESVLAKHNDFKKTKKTTFKYEDPVFKIVKQNGRNIVFILDISGSMDKNIRDIKMALVQWIENNVESSAQVGVATFNGDGKIISPLMSMNNTRTKKALIEKIQSISCYGFSNIASGLEEGINILFNPPKKEVRQYGSIVLISDEEGFGDSDSEYETVVKSITKSGAVFNVISLSNQSDSMFFKLSKKTNGMYTYVKDNYQMMSVLNNTLGVLQTRRIINVPKIKKSKIEVVSSSKNLKFTFTDEYTDDSTFINITFKKDISKYSVSLTDPSGNEITNLTSFKNLKKTLITFKIPGIAAPGEYSLNFKKHSQPKDQTTSKKNSKPKKHSKSREKRFVESEDFTNNKFDNSISKHKIPICSIGSLSKTEIDVLHGNSSVTVLLNLRNCDLTESEEVNAHLIIKSPSGTTHIKQMTDNGLGDDLTNNDHIFTRKIFPRDLRSKGIYTFSVVLEIYDIFTWERKKYTIFLDNLRIKIVSKSSLIDEITPAKMKKPSITIIGKNNKIVELKTIATGDDSMDGRINRYEILIRSTDSDYTKYVTKTEEPFNEITILLDLGDLETTGTIEVAVRGIDGSNNVGEWSEMTLVNLMD